MTFGSGPQALVDHLQENWQPSRSGRPDVPDVATTPKQERGVVVFHDRESVAVQHATHDLIHCYHPQAGPIQVQDRGYDEQNVQETVQIDIECTDRTDPDTQERLYARDRMVGDRDGAGFPTGSDAPYPGLLGETIYQLETARRAFEEWDRVEYTVAGTMLKNSDARMSLDVTLEHIAHNTV